MVFTLLARHPFSPCGRRWRDAPDEGSHQRRAIPHPSRACGAIHLLPQGEKETYPAPSKCLNPIAEAKAEGRG